jgi:hypothetical protein
LKIIGQEKPDNNLESPCVVSTISERRKNTYTRTKEKLSKFYHLGNNKNSVGAITVTIMLHKKYAYEYNYIEHNISIIKKIHL